MLNTPFAPWPSFSEEEAQAVAAMLRSNRVNYWTGDACRTFEREFAAWCGTPHAIALANGTVALDVALKALGIGPGDEVVVTPRTFIASVSCVVNAGATPVFADVDPVSGNLTADTIAAVLTPRTRAVICVHLAGWPCDMDPIMALAERHHLKVIEDCAQAHGARYRGRSVGSIGHVGAWSFCQDKILTTGGEGGMVTTNDDALWRAMWAYKDHGKSFAAVYERDHPPGFRWLHESFGTNWRMLEFQAVIGRIQLRQLPAWTAARQRHAQAILQALGPWQGPQGPLMGPPGRCASCPAPTGEACPRDCRHAFYKLYLQVVPQRLRPGWTRDRIIDQVVQAGVPCYQGSCSEVYLEKAFDGTPWRPAERLPVARALGENSLMLLVHPTLTPEQIDKTCETLTRVARMAFTD
ncbi:MAG: DegT/DnrJ/EryC1/StrS aminotransferase family protein [Hydrogenophaga sp.]|nr:DegT/DnrJ/EryC1/StrS aminotransferase family protein [Hydrogenophaga sp.]